MNNPPFLRRFLVGTLLSTFVFSVALSQQSTAPAPSVDRLREHVTYLASEKLEGRRTGSPGSYAATNYIAREFSRLGLKPYLPSWQSTNQTGARYLQHFPYVAGVELGKTNTLAIRNSNGTATSFRIGEDWMPLGISANGRIEKVPVVFASYGINDSELNYNDYANVDVTGKVAIALAGTPDGDNPHGRFVRYEDVRWKAIAAKNAGAKALLIITQDADLKGSRWSRLNYNPAGGDAGLMVGVASYKALGLEASEFEKVLAAAKQGRTALNLALPIDLKVDLVRREVAAYNVIGVLEGTDPVLKNEAIVIGAHYDHLGRGGEGSLAPKEGDIHHGADDNASGTAGLLELARIFSAQKSRRTIVFAAFSGEEEGLLGSNYYVNNPAVPLSSTIAMLNMDMIGRMKDKRLIIGGVGTAPEWRSMIETANLMQSVTVSLSGTTPSRANFPLVVASNGRAIVTSDASKQFQITMNEGGFGPSDHSSFYAKQIPVLFFWTGTHEDYHKPTDTADKINYEDHSRIVAVVAGIVRELDAADKRPTYAVTKSPTVGRSTGFRIYLGTIPNYSDSNEGLLLDGVREDSPAAKAGLRAGDRIVKLAGREVRNVYDYTYALGEMKAGEEYEVEVVRGSTRLTFKLTPAARR
jgi:aminopeptidase YwaD